jgi:hypothetical protein
MYSRFVKNPRPLGALLAAGLLCARAACSRSHTVTNADGSQPADYPKDAPIYTPSEVVMAQTLSEKNARNLTLASTDSVDNIAGFYKKALDGNGWKTGKLHILQVVSDKN